MPESSYLPTRPADANLFICITARQRVRPTVNSDQYLVTRTKHTHTSPFYSLLFLLPPLLAVIIYASTISHPLMYDTLLHTQLADGQTLLSVFLPDERFGFYRPLVFLPIVFFQNLLGRYPVWLFHWLNIITHALNALLLTKLVWRMTKERWQALAAGLLLASFPFAYQALAIYGNNPYLTVTFFILLGLNIALHQTNRWALPVVFILGALTHETAVLLIPLVLFLAWSRSGFSIQNLIQDQIRQNGALYLTATIYLVIYLFLPRGGGPTLNFGGNALLPKISLFLQTAAWPFVLVLSNILNGQAAILAGFALLAGWVIFLHWKGLEPGQTTSFKMGLVWFLLASLLIGITLPTYYIEDGARLLYPSGAGVAILWSGLLSFKGKSSLGFKSLSKLTPTALLICLVFAGTWFNRRMIDLYAMGSRPIHTIGETLSQERVNDDLIIVNLPQWVAWPQQVFPAGTEFAPVMGVHLFAAELVRANFNLTPQITILDVPEALAQTPYTYGVYKVGAVGELEPSQDRSIQIVATNYLAETPTGFWRGSIQPDQVGHDILWSTESIDFLKQTACAQDKNSVIFTSTLRLKVTLDESASLFIQALSENGRLVAQNDGPPLQISSQRLKAPPNSIIVDRRILEAVEQPTAILSGVYNFVSVEREQAYEESGASLTDNASLSNIQADCLPKNSK
ncbi:MAG: hypothetical protein AB8G95_04405 [Anaerolineae bacterium]